MIGLFDFDSLLYQCIYRIVSIAQIKFMMQTGSTKEEIRKYIIDEAYTKVLHRSFQILNSIEDTGIYFTDVKYYVTNCPLSRRKYINPDYKKNRKSNKWVKMLRERFIENEIVIHDVELEADDLIAIEAEKLKDEYVIISIDKDLQTIKGIHFDYYPLKENGEFIGFRGLNYITDFEAKKNFAIQMLVGDSTDSIKGCPKIGKVKSGKILENCKTEKQLLIAVYRQYYRVALDDSNYEYINEMLMNYVMLKLGKC